MGKQTTQLDLDLNVYNALFEEVPTKNESE